LTINKDRNMEIDIAKGIGIVLVLLGHILNSFQAGLPMLFIYTFHMPLFFIVSGLVEKEQSSISFKGVIKKTCKILSSYIFWSIIFLIFDIVFRLFLLHKYTVNSIFVEFVASITFYGINVLWFLATMFITKFCYYLLRMKLSKKVVLIVSIFIYPLSIILANRISYNQQSHSIYSFYVIEAIARAMCVLPFFTIGVYFKDIFLDLKKIIFAKRIRLVYISLVAIVLFSINWLLSSLCGNVDIHNMQFDNPILMPFLALSGSLGVLLVSLVLINLKGLNNVLVFYGTNSLFIMATHEWLYVKEFSIWLSQKIFSKAQVSSSLLILLILESILILLFSKVCDKMILNIKKIILNVFRIV